MDTQRRNVCPSCSKSFLRRAHMLRHQQQHTSQKPYSCVFCSKNFQRKDVLRGHLFRCELRGSLEVPEKQSKGRKRSSCDSCVSLRTRCDPGIPCSRCKDLGKPCIKSGNTPTDSELTDLRSHDQISINFLLNGPENNDFTGHFPTSQNRTDEIHHSDEVVALDQTNPVDWGDAVEAMESYDAFFGADMNFDSFFGTFERSLFGSPLIDADLMLPITDHDIQSVASSALESRAVEIRQQLRLAAIKLETLHEVRFPAELYTSIDLINHNEIEHCVDLYFHYYHRHCPIIHRPSFNSTTVPLPLLLSIMALGGMYHEDPTKANWLKSLLDIMETYIYGLPGLRYDYESSFSLSRATDEDTLYHQFEILQGAYLMIVAQYFSGSMISRKRARQQRFAQVLAIARSFNLPRAQHDRVVSIPDAKAFQLWVRKESQIRTMNIMISLDSAFGIFNNIPPRIDLCEVDLQLPCERRFFETANYHEMVVQSLFPKQKMKVFDAFQKLFVASREGAERFESMERGSLNSWDLLILIHLIYSFAWRQTFSNPLLRLANKVQCPPASVLDPLKLAIRNWKTVWDEARANILPKDLPEMGFESSADSYWTLTRLLVHRFDAKGDAAGRGLEIMPLDSDCSSQASHLRKILAGCK